MAISLSKNKSSKSRKRVEQKKQCCSIFKTLLSFFYKIPIAMSLLLVIYVWSSWTVIISGKTVHVCISSRKLNNLDCVSAENQPNFEIRIPLVKNGSEFDSAIANNMEMEKDRNSPNYYYYFVQSSRKDIDSSINHNLGYLEKKISINPIFDYSTNFSPIIINLELEKELIPSPSIATDPIIVYDNSSIYNQVNVLELVREDSNSTVRDRDEINNLANDVCDNDKAAAKALQDSFEVLHTWAPERQNKTQYGCEGRGIFVYDLPSKFNQDLVGQCHNMFSWVDFCNYFSNGGLGEPIPRLGKAWYRTHMYSLELIFHSRVLKHPCRVHDESEAKLFYVPFYGGLDILRWHFKNVSNDVKDSLGLDLINWLGKKASWSRNSGRDHVFTLGKISWDFRRNEGKSWGSTFLNHEKMQNPVKLLIERHPWHGNDVGVPHPTYFHPSSNDNIAAWQTKIISSERPHLASFAGGARRGAPRNIRSILIEQCNSVDDFICKFLDCKVGSGCQQPESVMELFMASEFCLQPPGDSQTRKSVFDSLVSGCIPVIFNPLTAYYQYPWHLPKDHGKYSVFVDQKEVRESKVNVVERLMKISKKQRDYVRRFIVYELLPGLVYAHNNDSRSHNFPDAFSIAIDSLLQRVNSL